METVNYIIVIVLALLGIAAATLLFIVLQLRNQKIYLQTHLEEITQNHKNLESQYNKLQAENHTTQLSLFAYQEKFQLQEKELSQTKKRIDELLQENKELHGEKARNQEALKNLQLQLQTQKEEIQTLHSELKKEFELLSSQLLEQNTQKLTHQNQQVIGNLLSPVKEYLQQVKELENKIQRYYDEENKGRASLKTEVENLTKHSNEVKYVAENLTRALTSQVKQQGIWGEMILERILEISGLEKDREYKLQLHIGDKRPDVVIYLPNDKHIILDAKVTLNSLIQYQSSQNEEEQTKYAQDIIQSIEKHYKDLSQREYEKLYALNSIDFVLMFLPLENVMSVIYKYKPALYEEALRRKVIFVTPTSLLTALRTIYFLWQKDKREKEIENILTSIQDLYDKMRVFTEYFYEIETHIHKVQKKFYDAKANLSEGKGNVMSILQKKILPYITPKETIKHYLPQDE